MDCLKAAVLNGADAVYFGGGAFNARRGAKNFTGDELKEALDYCRLRGVKTNITLNTLLFDSELRDALDFAAELVRLKADAVIVQDLGLAALIRRELPTLTVHASTQMGIHSLDGLRFCERLGISRAVLSRETPMDMIRLMHEKSPVELEFFCHGALCMGFSGSCLYSSMAGERSGNRGTCAQPCRKNASVINPRAGQNEFALSTNDICMLDELNALISAGVCSLKIEGRMKSPEYVATVTRVYRAALDGEKPNDAKRTLFEIFNRGGFSTAHLTGDSVTTGHVGAAKPSKELIAAAHESVRTERPFIEVAGKLVLDPLRPALLSLNGVSAQGPVCEAPKKPVDTERLSEQLKKLGGTPFFMNRCDIVGEGFIPVSAVNAIRREAVERLTESILGPENEKRSVRAEDIDGFIEPAGAAEGAPLRYLRVRSIDEAAAADGDIIGIDPARPAELDTRALKELGKRLVLILPNVLINESAAEDYEKLLESGCFSGIEANNIGEWRMGAALPVRIAGIGMNAMNSASFTLLLSLRFTHIMPSLELTRRQLEKLSQKFGAVTAVNTLGRAPLMQLMHCPMKEYRGCKNCKGRVGVLSDGDGRRFPLENVRFSDGRCLVRMLNSAVTDIREQFALSGISAAITCETPDNYGNDNITRGHWNRAVD